MPTIKVRKMQSSIEKVLCYWTFAIALYHTVLATFHYVIPYKEYTSYVQWAGLGLAIVSVLYLIVSFFISKDSRARTLSFLKKMCTFEQCLLIGIFICFLLSCYMNGKEYRNETILFKGHDWLIFDMAVCFFVLFPLARAVDIEQAKKTFEILIHVVVVTYTVFTIYCLWHILHLEVLDLLSGEQAGMTADYQLMLGKHYNLTGMISATLFCLCIYMVFTQDLATRILYGICGFIHLVVIYLSNSRTVFAGVLAFVIFASFFLVWISFHKRKTAIRFGASLLICAVISLLYWYGRTGTFFVFENITHLGEEIAAETGSLNTSAASYYPVMLASAKEPNQYIEVLSATAGGNIRQISDGLSLRQYIWRAAIKLLGDNPQITFFGVTPIEVPNALRDIGGYWTDVAHAHNAILQSGICFGVPAMGLFLVFLSTIAYGCIYILLRRDKNTKINILISAAILCIVVVNMAEPYIMAYFSAMECIFFLLCGFVTVTGEIEKKTGKSSAIRFCKPFVATAVSSAVIISVLFYSLNYLNINHKYINGKGTEDEPYKIENIENLKYFRDLVNRGNRFKNCFFLQTDNINLLDEEWTPIGLNNPHYEFCGVYDGGCHYIQNLRITNKNPYSLEHVGFFGMIDGTIQNFGIESGIIEGKTVGAIARFGGENSLIINCYNKADLSGTIRAGGICDNMKAGGMVVNCVNIGTLNAPRMGNLVSFDAALVAGFDKSRDVSDLFTGTFLALPLQGESVEDILNSGTDSLKNTSLFKHNKILTWD